MSESNQTLTKDSAAETTGAGKEVTLDEALELAKSHHQAGNFTIADRTYRDILNAVPDHFPTVHFLGLLCHQRGDNEEAEKLGRKAIEAAPENPNVWINFGVILQANKKYEEALAALDEAIAIEPEAYGAWANKSYTFFLMGRFEEAEEAALQATLIEPERVEGYINMGIALGEQGKLDEADAIWAQAAEMDPDSAKVYANWSNTLRDAGALEAALEKGEKAVELDKNSVDALCNLANAQRDLGKYGQALESYNKATDLQPDFAKAHANKAAALIDLGRYAEAIVSAKYAISFDKANGFAYSLLSQAQHGMGDHDEAYRTADQAVRLEPDNALHYINMAEALVAEDKYDEAEAIIGKAVELDPGDPRTLMALAEIRRGLDQIDLALEALDKAINNYRATPALLLRKAQILNAASRADEALDVIGQALEKYPENAQIMFGKADILLTNNRKDEARAVMEAAGKTASVEELPNYYTSLVQYKTFSREDEDFKSFVKMVENADKYSLDIQSSLHFSLFQALEKMGEYEEAFTHLKKGNDLQIEFKKIDPDLIFKGGDRIAEDFPPEILAQYDGLGFESDIPVFVVGMPRSGTTLTEQIISSHRDVCGAGELQDLGNVIRELGPLTPERAREMGAAYVERVRRRDPGGQALRITDKMPGNYFNIGLIKAILPQARIIHCRRSPMDNLLSCYKQNFAMGHAWSYHLEMAARNYVQYAAVMAHWREVLPPGSMLEVDYEETVGDLEAQARRLIDYVGLEWDEACLEPHKQKRAVLTASKNQVIRPVYKTSVEAWRRYETQLKPMYDILAEAGLVGG